MATNLETDQQLKQAEEELQKLKQQLKATKDPDDKDRIYDAIEDLEDAIYTYKSNRWP